MTPRESKPLIAVLEDHDDTRELLLIYLENEFSVKAFREVGDLLTALEQEKFAAIVTDIMLPGIDGYDFVERLRRDSRFASLPVIAVTALAMASDRERVIASGFTEYLIKPIEPQEVAKAVRRCLELPRSGVSPAS
jgi:CheY-like chemotaxis protein